MTATIPNTNTRGHPISAGDFIVPPPRRRGEEQPWLVVEVFGTRAYVVKAPTTSLVVAVAPLTHCNSEIVEYVHVVAPYDGFLASGTCTPPDPDTTGARWRWDRARAHTARIVDFEEPGRWHRDTLRPARTVGGHIVAGRVARLR